MTRLPQLFSAIFTLLVIAFLWWPPAQLFIVAVQEIIANPASAAPHFSPSPAAWSLLRNTMTLGVLTSLGALLLGAPVGIALCRAPRVLRSLFFVLCAVPLAVPPIVLATCWLQITRTPPARSMAALAATQSAQISPVFLSACVLALCFFPIVSLSVASALHRLPHESEDAARSFGSGFSTWKRVLVPQLSPAIWGALGAVFLLSMWEMGAPDLLDARTYSVEVYRNLYADDALGQTGKNVRAALASLPMFLLSIPALYLVLRAFTHESRRGASEAHGEYAMQNIARGETLFVVVYALVVMVLSPVFPLGALVKTLGDNGAWHTLRESWSDTNTEIGNTLQLSTLCALIAVGIAFVMVAQWRTWSSRARSCALLACLLPLLIAPILHGVALVSFWNTPQFPLVGGLMSQTGVRVLDGFYEWCARFALPLIGLLSRFLPLAILLMYGAARRTDKTLFEAAENVGASPTRASYNILWRTLRVPMLGIFGLLWALSGAELSVSVLTQQPGGQPLTLPIFQLMHIFVMDKVAALCLILCGFSALVMALCGVAARLGRKQ